MLIETDPAAVAFWCGHCADSSPGDRWCINQECRYFPMFDASSRFCRHRTGFRCPASQPDGSDILAPHHSPVWPELPHYGAVHAKEEAVYESIFIVNDQHPHGAAGITFSAFTPSGTQGSGTHEPIPIWCVGRDGRPRWA